MQSKLLIFVNKLDIVSDLVNEEPVFFNSSETKSISLFPLSILVTVWKKS